MTRKSFRILLAVGALQATSLVTQAQLSPGVTAYGGAYAEPDVHLTGDIVHLSGVVHPGTGTLGNLPVGLRPAGRMIFSVWSGTGQARVDVLPDGDVIVVTGGQAWISLSGISFPRVAE